MARTEVKIEFTDPGNRFPGCHGTVDLALTSSEATTEVCYAGGLPIARIRNNSGGSITVTIRDAATKDGTTNSCDDGAGSALASLTIANNTSRLVPMGFSGITWLVMTLASGTATVNVAFGR